MKILAFLLIAAGIAGIGWGGLEWKQREKVGDLGPVEITREKTRSIPIPPVLGIAALAGGVILLMKRP
ncbi:MAG: DUF3185 domain-containing protein [Acidobacteria bacterium]|nr:DUF3185 domain-containing protein [Acidobacteriota bacterium]